MFSLPLIERVVYSLAMFHPNGDLKNEGHQIEDLDAFFSFLRALPFISVTRHLPAVAALASLLNDAFASQLNLVYVLLRCCATCADLASPAGLPFLQQLDVCDLPPDMNRFTEAFEAIDGCFVADPKRGSDAYERLNAFTQRAVALHNAVLLKAPEERHAFLSLTPKDLCPHVSVENTLIPLMGINFEGWPDDCLAAGKRMIEELSDTGLAPWFTDDSNDDAYRRIDFGRQNEKTDIFGFTDEIFRESVRKITVTHQMASLLKRLASANDRDDRPVVPPETGLVLVLALLQEGIGEGPADIVIRLREKVKKMIVKAEETNDTFPEWERLDHYLAMSEITWGSECFWSLTIRRCLKKLPLPLPVSASGQSSAGA
jgi:hypothetical protein